MRSHFYRRPHDYSRRLALRQRSAAAIWMRILQRTLTTIPIGPDGGSLLDVPALPSGIGGNAPEQVEWSPCDLRNPSHRRAHQDIGRGLHNINQMLNFPRVGTVPTGGLWDGTTTPNTIAVHDDELGWPVVVNLPLIPGKDPNLRAGDQVFFFVRGGVAQSLYEYHDDKVGTLKFWTGDPDDIEAGWGIANNVDDSGAGTTNHASNGGSGLDYVSNGFIVCANTAGTVVAAGTTSGAGDHDHDGSSTNINVDPLRTVVANAAVNDHASHTHLVEVDSHASHTHLVDVPTHENHHHHIVIDVARTAGSDFTTNTEDTSIEQEALTHAQVSSGVPDLELAHNLATSAGPSPVLSHTYAGHYHSIDGHSHTALNIIADGGHSHTAGAPAYMTAIPIERIP